VVQGSTYPDLRRQNAEALVALDFPGYAIGGLAVGEPKAEMYKALDTVLPLLPDTRPRYLMGLGTPEDLAACVDRGVDMFDCVIPTRNGRNGTVYTREGKLVIKNAEYKNDPEPIDRDCACYSCRRFSRAYLRHLFQCGEMLGPRLATLHNIHFFLELMRQMRTAILADRFGRWKNDFLNHYSATPCLAGKP
jgi:queuine tRNA-ribosyltransferase